MTSGSPPSFLVTIDTEGDNQWVRPRTITTRNSRYLPRFQKLCEAYGLRPTYLTNWEMAECPDFRRFGEDVLAADAAEIGMHLHAWNTPPSVPLTDDDHGHAPYLTEYPRDQMAAKIGALTEKLRRTFGVPMVSHRAGRWGFDATYAQLLAENGYRVDCSITPNVSWRGSLGDPRRGGGPDYAGYPDSAYRLDLEDVRRPGSSPLLEVPVTTFARRRLAPLERARRIPGAGRVLDRLFPRALWIRPNGRNGAALPRLLERVRTEGRDYAQFMLHSSELMPGGSPKFTSDASVDALYDDMERLFAATAPHFVGRTLREYHEHWTARAGHS